MADSVTDQLREAINERLRKPFVFSFFFSWCAANYRVVIALFGDAKFNEKINYIDALHPTNWDRFVQWAVLPFLGAAFYMFAVPWINLAASRFAEWVENWGWPRARAFFYKQLVSRDELADIHASYQAQ